MIEDAEKKLPTHHDLHIKQSLPQRILHQKVTVDQCMNILFPPSWTSNTEECKAWSEILLQRETMALFPGYVRRSSEKESHHKEVITILFWKPNTLSHGLNTAKYLTVLQYQHSSKLIQVHCTLKYIAENIYSFKKISTSSYSKANAMWNICQKNRTVSTRLLVTWKKKKSTTCRCQHLSVRLEMSTSIRISR